MSQPLISIVEGWSAPLRVTLLVDEVPVDLTGLTVKIVLKNNAGTIIKDTTEGVSVTASTAGQVEYSPATSSGDLFLSASTPYKVRFRVTDALSKSYYHPSDEEDLIEVNPL